MKIQNWTQEQEYCIEVLSIFAKGYHHVRGLKPFGDGVSIIYSGCDLSTYDGSDLTRLVLISHAYGIRAHIEQGGPGSVKIVAFKREHGERKDMRQWEWHPGIDELKVEADYWKRIAKEDVNRKKANQ